MNKHQLTPERLKELLSYDPLTGSITFRRTCSIKVPSEEGYIEVYDRLLKKNHKLKANKLCWTLAYGVKPRKDQHVMHKDFDDTNYKLNNLMIVNSSVYFQLKEAYRNLRTGIKLLPHETDQFCYVVTWYEKNLVMKKTIGDLIIARRFVTKLKLKYSKILTKYCLFE